MISGNQSDMKSEEVNRGHVTSGRTKSDVSKGHTEGERGRKLERPKSIIKSSNKENLKGIRLNQKRFGEFYSVEFTSGSIMYGGCSMFAFYQCRFTT